MSRLSFLLGALGLSLGHHSLPSFDRDSPPYLKPEDRQRYYGRKGTPRGECGICFVTLRRDDYCGNRMCEGYMLRKPKPRDYWPGRAKTEGEYYRNYGLQRPKMRPAKAYGPTYCRWCGHRISYRTYSIGECAKCKRTPVGFARAMAVGGAR